MLRTDSPDLSGVKGPQGGSRSTHSETILATASMLFEHPRGHCNTKWDRSDVA